MTKVPTAKKLMPPVLAALKAIGGSGTTEEIGKKVIEQLKLPDHVTNVIHNPKKGKQTELFYRLAWARTLLRQIGAVGNPRKGIWSLKTDAKVAPTQVTFKMREDKVQQKSTSPAAFPMPECVPFRPSSGYAKVFAILYAYRDTGISKCKLLDCYARWSLKDIKRADYDVGVVISAKENGSSHKRISKAAQHYWVVKKNGLLKLHLAEKAPGSR